MEKQFDLFSHLTPTSSDMFIDSLEFSVCQSYYMQMIVTVFAIPNLLLIFLFPLLLRWV